MGKRKSVRFSGEDSVSTCSGSGSPLAVEPLPFDPKPTPNRLTPTKSILVDTSDRGRESTQSEPVCDTKVKELNSEPEKPSPEPKISFLEFLAETDDQKLSASPKTDPELTLSRESATPSTRNIKTDQLLQKRPHSAPANHFYKDSNRDQWFSVSSPKTKPEDQGGVEVRTYCLKSIQKRTKPARSETKPNPTRCATRPHTTPTRHQCYTKSNFALFGNAGIDSKPQAKSLTTTTEKMSGNIFNGGQQQCLGRVFEKKELQDLNDRLSHYIKHVQELKQDGGGMDSSAFLDSIQVLENELVSLKALYERELEQARQQAEDVSREKNMYVLEANKTKSLASDLENRLALESDKGRRVQDEVNILQRSLMLKDQEAEESRIAMQRPLQDLEHLRRDYENAVRELEKYKSRCEKEILQRQAAEEKGHQLQQKLDFQAQLRDQESKEVSERLNAATVTILTLEAKLREMNTPDNSIAMQLQKVREAAEAELQQYKQESEETFNQNLMEIRVQLEETCRRLEDSNGQNGQLSMQVGDLTTKLRSQEGQISMLEHQCQSLEDLLRQERLEAQDRICKLERQLQQLQETLMAKMQEANASREAHLPLKAEIEAFKVLLAEEERRLKIAQSCGIVSCSLPAAPRQAFATSAVTTGAISGIPAKPLCSVRTSSSMNRSSYLPPSSQGGVTAQPLGPIRARSAPANHAQRRAQLVPTSLGHGRDYFDEMFNDLTPRDTLNVHGGASAVQSPYTAEVSEQRTVESVLQRPDNPEPDSREGLVLPMERPPSSTYHDYTTCSSSATAEIQIMEVQPQGKYIRLLNTSQNKDIEIGQYMLQQNVGGHPVAVFRFPARSRFPAKQTVTVWSGSNDHKLHQPPANYVFKEQTKWGTGPECTTILCKPSGQAIAWMTAAHRFSPDAYIDSGPGSLAGSETAEMNQGQEELTEFNMDVNAPPPAPVYIRREKEERPSFHPPKHPHGCTPPTQVHPHTGQGRVLTYGNDNSSVNRQSRNHSQRPDPIPGAPYAGASAQRMGSGSLRRYQSPCTIRGSGAIANKSDGATSTPPSPFQKPHARFNTGLDQVQSQNNVEFQPPMPRPPLFAAW